MKKSPQSTTTLELVPRLLLALCAVKPTTSQFHLKPLSKLLVLRPSPTQVTPGMPLSSLSSLCLALLQVFASLGMPCAALPCPCYTPPTHPSHLSATLFPPWTGSCTTCQFRSSSTTLWYSPSHWAPSLATNHVHPTDLVTYQHTDPSVLLLLLDRPSVLLLLLDSILVILNNY